MNTFLILIFSTAFVEEKMPSIVAAPNLLANYLWPLKTKEETFQVLLLGRISHDPRPNVVCDDLIQQLPKTFVEHARGIGVVRHYNTDAMPRSHIIKNANGFSIGVYEDILSKLPPLFTGVIKEKA